MIQPYGLDHGYWLTMVLFGRAVLRIEYNISMRYVVFQEVGGDSDTGTGSSPSPKAGTGRAKTTGMNGPDRDRGVIRFLYHTIKMVAEGDDKEDMLIETQQVVARTKRLCQQNQQHQQPTQSPGREPFHDMFA